MRQFRGRLDWTRISKKPRVGDQQRETEQAEDQGRREAIDREENRLAACLQEAPIGAVAMVGDLRKLAGVLDDPGLVQLAAYATPIYMIPHPEAILSEAKLIVACMGWDHQQRARQWAILFNEVAAESGDQQTADHHPEDGC